MRILPLVLIFLSGLACAVGPPWVVRLATGATLTATFPNTAQLTGPTKILTIQCENLDTNEIEVNCSSFVSNVAPTINSGQGIYVESSDTWSSPSNSNLGSACYIRNNTGGSVTLAGPVICTAWGN